MAKTNKEILVKRLEKARKQKEKNKLAKQKQEQKKAKQEAKQKVKQAKLDAKLKVLTAKALKAKRAARIISKEKDRKYREKIAAKRRKARKAGK